MKPFRFHRDGLFITGCVAYLLNRLLFKHVLGSAFLHNHFNDLWLIPCALPLVLWIHHQLGWRGVRPPTLAEVLGHLTIWSLLFEWWGPLWMLHATSDPMDVLSYWTGGLLAWAWWNRARLLRRPLTA